MSFGTINFLQKDWLMPRYQACKWDNETDTDVLLGCVCLFSSNSLTSRAEQTTELVQQVAGLFLVQVTIIYWQCLMLYLLFAEVGETKRKIDAVAGESFVSVHSWF